MKGCSRNAPQKVHPNFAQNLGRHILVGNGPNTVSESTVSNTELSEFFGPHRVLERERAQWVPLSLWFVCQSELTESFLQSSPSFAVKVSEAQWVLFSETVLSKQYSARFLSWEYVFWPQDLAHTSDKLPLLFWVGCLVMLWLDDTLAIGLVCSSSSSYASPFMFVHCSQYSYFLCSFLSVCQFSVPLSDRLVSLYCLSSFSLLYLLSFLCGLLLPTPLSIHVSFFIIDILLSVSCLPLDFFPSFLWFWCLFYLHHCPWMCSCNVAAAFGKGWRTRRRLKRRKGHAGEASAIAACCDMMVEMGPTYLCTFAQLHKYALAIHQWVANSSSPHLSEVIQEPLPLKPRLLVKKENSLV